MGLPVPVLGARGKYPPGSAEKRPGQRTVAPPAVRYVAVFAVKVI
jgi:hypothetical protein